MFFGDNHIGDAIKALKPKNWEALLAKLEQDDKNQFDKVIQILEELDTSDQKSMDDNKLCYVFVEDSWCLSPQFVNEGRAHILEGLVSRATGKPFRRTVIVDVEVRKVSSLALGIFCEKDPLNLRILRHQSLQMPHPANNRHVHHLLFEDVLREYDSLTKQMLDYKEMWKDDAIRNEFDKALQESMYSFRQLKVEIDRIGSQQPLLGYSEFLLEKGDHALRKRLAALLLCSFCVFVDLYIYHRVLLLRSEPIEKILVFAGRGHQNEVTLHLQEANYRNATFVADYIEQRILVDADFEKIKKPLARIIKEEFPWLHESRWWCNLL